MERHRKVYCPAIKTKTAAGKKSQKPHKPPAQETTEEPVKAPERKKSNPEARGSKGMKYAIIYSNSPASEDEIRVTFLVNEMDPKDPFDGYFAVTAKKALTETVTSLMRKASEFLASRNLKPLHEELSFNFVNRASLSDRQARAAFMKGLNNIIWESTHKKPVETVTGPGTETEAKGPLAAKLQEKRIIPEKADQASVKSDEWRWRQPRNKVKNTKNIFFIECKQKIPVESMLPKERKCPECRKKLVDTGSSWNTISYGHLNTGSCTFHETIFIAPSSELHGGPDQKWHMNMGRNPWEPKIWGRDGPGITSDFDANLATDLQQMGELYSSRAREIRPSKDGSRKEPKKGSTMVGYREGSIYHFFIQRVKNQPKWSIQLSYVKNDGAFDLGEKIDLDHWSGIPDGMVALIQRARPLLKDMKLPEINLENTYANQHAWHEYALEDKFVLDCMKRAFKILGKIEQEKKQPHHDTREPEKVPGRKKKVPAETIHDPAPEKEKSRKEEPVSEWKPGNTFDPRIPRKEKRKKRPLYHDIHLVQTDLFKFFPQNQSNLAEYFVMEGGGRIVSTPRRKS
jgi:hypothetical protein